MPSFSIKEFVVRFDFEDQALVDLFKWSVYDFSRPSASIQRHYAQTNIDGRSVYMHRLIAKAGKGQEVDHINLNGLDNRRDNLRIVTRSQNSANKPSYGGTSKYKGVCRANTKSPRYRAWVMKDKKSTYLGSFKSEIEAALAYNAAAFALWGEYALLNKID